MYELETPKEDNYTFYQCIVNMHNNIECQKIDKDKYILIEKSTLVPVKKIYPEFLHRFVIKSAMTPKNVTINK